MGGWLVGHHGATAAMGGEREAGSDTEAATRAPLPAPGPSSDPAAGPMDGGFEHMDPWMGLQILSGPVSWIFGGVCGF